MEIVQKLDNYYKSGESIYFRCPVPNCNRYYDAFKRHYTLIKEDWQLESDIRIYNYFVKQKEELSVYPLKTALYTVVCCVLCNNKIKENFIKRNMLFIYHGETEIAFHEDDWRDYGDSDDESNDVESDHEDCTPWNACAKCMYADWNKPSSKIRKLE